MIGKRGFEAGVRQFETWHVRCTHLHVYRHFPYGHATFTCTRSLFFPLLSCKIFPCIFNLKIFRWANPDFVFYCMV